MAYVKNMTLTEYFLILPCRSLRPQRVLHSSVLSVPHRRRPAATRPRITWRISAAGASQRPEVLSTVDGDNLAGKPSGRHRVRKRSRSLPRSWCYCGQSYKCSTIINCDASL